jgi:hypothetical protein
VQRQSHQIYTVNGGLRKRNTLVSVFSSETTSAEEEKQEEEQKAGRTRRVGWSNHIRERIEANIGKEKVKRKEFVLLPPASQIIPNPAQ